MKGSRASHSHRRGNNHYNNNNNNNKHLQPYHKMPNSSSSSSSSGMWKPAGSCWEREYCESVGISWDHVLYCSNEVDQFENIAKWDDSGAYEAFQIAKQRYWALRHGLHFQIPLPGPDLYIQEIDWNFRPQADTEMPERHQSSSEERNRTYYKRGYRGRRKNYHRPTGEQFKKYNWNTQDCQTGSGTHGNRGTDGKEKMNSWNRNAIDYKEQRQNPVPIVRTGWEDGNEDSRDLKPLGSAWEDHKAKDNDGWDSCKNDGKWGFTTLQDSDGKALNPSVGYANGTELMKESTVTSRTGLTETGMGLGDSFGWRDQKSNEVSRGNGNSGWTCHEGNKHFLIQRDDGWNSQQFNREKMVGTKEESGQETGLDWRSAPFVPQNELAANQWPNQYSTPDHFYNQSCPLAPMQWNASQQWQTQQHPTWNSVSADPHYPYKGNWVAQPTQTFPQDMQTWYQPSQMYPQAVWHPTSSNQGYWPPASQYKEDRSAPKERGYASWRSPRY